jgi:hypothetical protein
MVPKDSEGESKRSPRKLGKLLEIGALALNLQRQILSLSISYHLISSFSSSFHAILLVHPGSQKPSVCRFLGSVLAELHHSGDSTSDDLQTILTRHESSA